MADDLTKPVTADVAKATAREIADREANFEGHGHRECGEHRTVGPHRAWCFNCQEWCYPEAPCASCELPAVRAELERLRKELSDTQRERAAGKLERIADWDEIGEYTRSVEAERDALKAANERVRAVCAGGSAGYTQRTVRVVDVHRALDTPTPTEETR